MKKILLLLLVCQACLVRYERPLYNPAPITPHQAPLLDELVVVLDDYTLDFPQGNVKMTLSEEIAKCKCIKNVRYLKFDIREDYSRYKAVLFLTVWDRHGYLFSDWPILAQVLMIPIYMITPADTREYHLNSKFVEAFNSDAKNVSVTKSDVHCRFSNKKTGYGLFGMFFQLSSAAPKHALTEAEEKEYMPTAGPPGKNPTRTVKYAADIMLADLLRQQTAELLAHLRKRAAGGAPDAPKNP